MKTCGEVEVWFHALLTSLDAGALVPLGHRSRYVGWTPAVIHLDTLVRKNLCPRWESNHDSLDVQPVAKSLCWMSYSNSRRCQVIYVEYLKNPCGEALPDGTTLADDHAHKTFIFVRRRFGRGIASIFRAKDILSKKQGSLLPAYSLSSQAITYSQRCFRQNMLHL
jgi:hypothetical protein